VIFYTIYKNQQLGSTIGVTFSRKGPWKDLHVRNWVPMAAVGAGSPIPARPAALRTGEGARRVRGPLRAGLGHWPGWKEPPAGGAPVTRGGGRRGCYWPARVARGNEQARWRAPMRARGGVGGFNWERMPVGRGSTHREPIVQLPPNGMRYSTLLHEG
jgi:hypothetical protein